MRFWSCGLLHSLVCFLLRCKTKSMSPLIYGNNDLFVCTRCGLGVSVSVCMCVFMCCMCALTWAVPPTASWQSSRGGVGFHHAVYSPVFTVSEVGEVTSLCACVYVCMCLLLADVSRLWCKAHRDMASPCRGESTLPPLCPSPLHSSLSSPP